MKLSIITINFNDHKGLDKTIQSVINQTYKDFEYIVIDGASTDGSVGVIKKYADRLTHWVSEPDTGIYNAMNKGTRLAQGEYCLYLNSGDFFAADDVLEKAFSYNFTEDIVSCNLELFDERNVYLQTPPQNISLFTFTNGSLPHPSTFIKRSLLEELGGYNESYRIVSDWCFFLDALIIRNCSYQTVDIVLSKFNCFGVSSLSGKKSSDEMKKYLNLKFPTIIKDYLPYEDEAVYNVMQWIQSHFIFKTMLLFPFKVINRLLKLRNRLCIRVGVYAK
jgi:glycosyltransferase involved in cell wall biosynthesis